MKAFVSGKGLDEVSSRESREARVNMTYTMDAHTRDKLLRDTTNYFETECRHVRELNIEKLLKI